MNLFVTGGTWVHGSGDPITEESPVNPPPRVACRPAIVQRLRTAAADGIRTVVRSSARPAAMQASCDSLHTEVWALPGVLAMMLPRVRVMMERWGLPGGRSPVPLLLSPPVREESFRVSGCSGGLERGRG